jgi:hypothetical protein
MKKRNYLHLLWINIGIIWMWLCLVSCQDNYTPFDTASSLELGNIQIRFVNLDFNKPQINIELGGKIYKQNLAYREITAYQTINSDILGDSIVKITDGNGQVLCVDTIAIQLGNNYTFAIKPAYEQVLSQYQQFSPPTIVNGRLMLKVKKDISELAVIPDPILPPFSDRTSARFVALARDHAFLTADISTGGYVNNTHLRLVEQYKDFDGYPKGDVIVELPGGFNADEAAIIDPYQVLYRLSSYQVFSPKNASVVSVPLESAGGANDNQATMRGYADRLYTNTFSFQAGKSYTIISNGTQGFTNDVALITDEEIPIALEPIPYEVYILDDTDGTARVLNPETMMPLEELTATIRCYQLDKSIQPSIALSSNGTFIKDLVETTLDNLYTTDKFGNQALASAPVISTYSGGVPASYPILAQTQVSLEKGGNYAVYFYQQDDGSRHLKVLKDDEIYKKNILRINFAHFSSDVGAIKVINSLTGQTLISQLNFEEESNYVEFPINIHCQPNEYYWDCSKDVLAHIQIVSVNGSQVLADFPLNRPNYSGLNTLIGDYEVWNPFNVSLTAYMPSPQYKYTFVLKGKQAIGDFSVGLISQTLTNTPETTGDMGSGLIFKYFETF